MDLEYFFLQITILNVTDIEAIMGYSLRIISIGVYVYLVIVLWLHIRLQVAVGKSKLSALFQHITSHLVLFHFLQTSS